MLTGLVSGTLSLAILFGTPSLTLPIFLLATAIAANYFVTMALAPSFPKTAWIDPEFASVTPRPFGFAPQQLISYVIRGVVIIAVVSAISA